MTPTAFLQRVGTVHGDCRAIVEAGESHTYADMFDRCRRFAGALVSLGIKRGDRVAILAPNSGTVLEAHFGVPWAEGILNPLNTRLSPQEIAYIVDHVSSKILIVDAELLAPAVLKARQGVNNVVSEPIRVWADGHEVPHDGEDTPRPAWRAACDVGQQPRLNSRPLVVPATDCRAR
jgi:acyl-CoA synthetase (AMP-forming)/AMP-acid ligase II